MQRFPSAAGPGEHASRSFAPAFSHSSADMTALPPGPETMQLFRDISRFFHRWHCLEATLGADGGSVLDFDFCPREHLDALEKPFPHRLAALQALELLRERLETLPCLDGIHNPTFLKHKLLGAATYLRALMGQRYSFHEYLYATMGIHPEPTPFLELAEARDELLQALSHFGIPFSDQGLLQLEQQLIERDHNRFSAELCTAAEVWVQRLHSLLHLSAAPRFRIEVASVDAYWANWIDGSLNDGIRLRINVHPRITFYQGAAVGYAVHEIGGHALHVLEMNLARTRGQLDAPGMNLTVHSCEAFQMEGLAQGVLELVAESEELSPALKLDQALRAWHGLILNNAHLALEGGVGFDVVARDLLQTSPLTRPGRILSDLRDRMRNPLFRSYIHVYAPSRKTFLSARTLPMAQRIEFLRMMYTGLYTPAQIQQALTKVASQPA